LHAVREKRYPDSRYANLATCRQELQQAAEIFLRHNIPVISTAGKSIEETATQALQALKLSMHPDTLPA
jgi:regulator of PEP synthase PpsR (kinase-PPPase family)